MSQFGTSQFLTITSWPVQTLTPKSSPVLTMTSSSIVTFDAVTSTLYGDLQALQDHAVPSTSTSRLGRVPARGRWTPGSGTLSSFCCIFAGTPLFVASGTAVRCGPFEQFTASASARHSLRRRRSAGRAREHGHRRRRRRWVLRTVARDQERPTDPRAQLRPPPRPGTRPPGHTAHPLAAVRCGDIAGPLRLFRSTSIFTFSMPTTRCCCSSVIFGEDRQAEQLDPRSARRLGAAGAGEHQAPGGSGAGSWIAAKSPPPAVPRAPGHGLARAPRTGATRARPRPASAAWPPRPPRTAGRGRSQAAARRPRSTRPAPAAWPTARPRLQGVEAAVEAGHLVLVFPPGAVVGDHPHPPSQLVRVGHHGARVAVGAEVLAGSKLVAAAWERHGGPAPVPPGALGLRGVAAVQPPNRSATGAAARPAPPARTGGPDDRPGARRHRSLHRAVSIRWVSSAARSTRTGVAPPGRTPPRPSPRSCSAGGIR